MGLADDASKALRTLAATRGGYDKKGRDMAYHLKGDDIRARFGNEVTDDELERFLRKLGCDGRIRNRLVKAVGDRQSPEEFLKTLQNFVLKYGGEREGEVVLGYGVAIHPR